MQLLEVSLGYSAQEIVGLLYRMNNAKKKRVNPEILTSREAKLVEEVFNSYGLLTWQSFVTTRLPLLKKPKDILAKIRTGEIEYTKGMAIANLKLEKEREQLLAIAIRESLTVSEIKERVSQIKTENDQNQEKPRSLKNYFGEVVASAKRDKNLWDDKTKVKQIEKILKQLEKILES